MRIATQCMVALGNVFSAKLRSVLAILGIVVGTAAVVALMTSSRLATSHAMEQFKHMGTHLITMNLASSRSNNHTGHLVPSFTPTLIHSLETAVPALDQVAPYALLYQPTQIAGRRVSADILVSTPGLYPLAKIQLARGRLLSDLDGAQAYCVLGQALAKQFWAVGMDPLGQTITVGSRVFVVVGIAKKWPRSFYLMADVNHAVLLTAQAGQSLSGQVMLTDAMALLGDRVLGKTVEQQVKAYLHAVYPHLQVNTMSSDRILVLMSKERETFNHLLIAIGSISLVVGGIGVMNILLVSVIERRREIGIRIAIGAQQRQILMMFLLESIVLTSIGGLVGVLVGVVASYVLATLSGWTFYWYGLPPLLGFVVSFLVGVVSGFYPAWRASQSDPIACMRD